MQLKKAHGAKKTQHSQKKKKKKKKSIIKKIIKTKWIMNCAWYKIISYTEAPCSGSSES